MNSTAIDTQVLAGLALVSGLIGLFLIPVATLLNRDFLRTTPVKAFLLAVFCAILGAGAAIYQGLPAARFLMDFLHHRYFMNTETEFRAFVQALLKTLSAGLLPFFAIPFVLLLFKQWTGKLSSPGYRSNFPGLTWARPSHFVYASLTGLFLWLGFDCPFLVALALPFVGLLTIALQDAACHRPEGGYSGPPAAPAPSGGMRAEDLTEERRRVLTMLQEGKISVEESAELLNALGESLHSGARRARPITGGTRFLVVGAGCVLAGFLLPWFSVDLGQEMSRMTAPIAESMGPLFQGTPSPIQDMNRTMLTTPAGQLFTNGGDIKGGLGWVVLALGLGTAILPFVGVSLTPLAKRNAMVIMLIAGAAILLYLLSGNARNAAPGIFIVCTGYALELVGALRERPNGTASA